MTPPLPSGSPLRRALAGLIFSLGIALFGVVTIGCFVSVSEAQPTEYPHADFVVTDELLAHLIAELPPQTQQRIQRLPQYFLELLFASLDELPPKTMQLVDKTHSLLPGYQPDDVVALDQYQSVLLLTRSEIALSAVAIPDLLAMSAEAARTGIEIPISSAYRSYAHQEFVYNNSLAAFGVEETERSVARPGYSQHQLGTTIDFGNISDGFEDTDAGRWLLEHGWRFGFSLSYPRGASAETGYKYESWHYRYIGRSAAKLGQYFFDRNQQLLLTYLEQNRPLLTDLLIPIDNHYR